MKLGLSTATFFGKILTEDSFETMRQMGAEVCEVFLTTFFEYREDFAKLLAQKSKDIEIHSVHSLNNQFEPELYNIAERTRTDAEKIFRDVCLCGKNLNAKFYTFHGPARLKKKEYIFDYEYLGKRTEEICNISKDYNLTLCYENVHWTFFSEPGYYKNLKKYSQSLRACLDIKQAIQNKIDYKLFIEEMGDDLETVHLCDYDNFGNTRIPGKGIFDFEELFRMLKYNGYKGPLIVELYSGDYNSFEELNSSFNYLKEILKKIN